MEEGECDSDSVLPDKASTTSEVEKVEERPRRRPLPFEVSREYVLPRRSSPRDHSRSRTRSRERSREREKKKHKRKKAREKSRSRTPKRKRHSRSRDRSRDKSRDRSRDKHKRTSHAKSEDVIEIESDDGGSEVVAPLPPARDKFVSSESTFKFSF